MIKILKFYQIIFIILLFQIIKTNQLVDDLKLVKDLTLSNNHHPHSNHHTSSSGGDGGSSGSTTSINYDAPDDCKYQIVNNKYDIKLVCYLRTVNSEFDTTNFSVIPAENTVSLAINCDDDIMVKSSLESKSFVHLAYLYELSLEYCKFIKLKKDVLFGMDGLKNLTIRTHNINWPALSLEIEAESFVYTKNLEKLDLSCNNIWSLPENLFCNLNALKWLNVSENRLQDVNDIGFREKSSAYSEYSCSLDVELLDISHNHFVLLPNNSFGLLKRLKYLKLHNNEISMIADTALNGLKNLQIINLSSNRIVALPPKLFEDQSKSIQEIYLHNNSITVLSPGLFSNLDQLQALDLSQNQLTSSWIKSNTFAGLIRLVLLNLSHNKITKLDAAIFIDLYQLQILNLCFNHIEILPANTFSPMNNLHTLLLSNNRVKYLDGASLNGLYVLSLLSLDNNQMGDIHLNAFKNCSSLQDLNLNGNQLKRIPQSLNDLRLLRTLDLGENHITYINNFTFTGMFSLYGIRLIGNKIENITKNTFKNLPNLQILNLARNKIATIENGSFEIITTIQAIRLDGNFILSIDGLFENMTNLLWLNISDNKLTQFDYAQVPRNLQWLDLHKNNLTELTDRLNLESHLHLQTLDASFNRITKITSHSFPNSIELLFLNDNLITAIEPYTFVLKSNLTRVDLYANQLTTLDIKSLRLDAGSARDKFLPEFYIGGNPFICDCNIDWLQKINHVTTQQYPIIMDIDTVYCKLLYNRDRSFIQLIKAEPKHFLCSYHIHCFALCQCCDFDACDCEMTCPQNCTCFHDQSWSTNIVVCSQSGYNEIPSNVPMDTTELYIDGNNFTTLSGHSFIGRKNLIVLYTNNSNIEHIYNTTFSGLRRLIILHLEQNRIQELYGNEFSTLENLCELYLHKNLITSINNRTFMALKALEVLTLSDNKLVRYDLMFVQQYNVNLKRVTLSGNLWTCDCKFLMKFQKFLNLKGDKIWDSSQIGCVYNNATNIVKERNGIKCTSKNELADSLSSSMSNMESLIPLLVIVTCTLIGFSALIFALFCYRRELKFWMYSNVCYRSNDNMLNDKMHDAYIIHSLQDDHFISQILGLVLENDIGLNLCLHYRDLNLNAYITDSILDAVDNSKRIIIVLSKNFLYNEWSRFEYKSAIYDILKKQKKIIFILYGDLPQKDIDHNMKEYLKINTCIEWDDTKFWKKLRITLPKSKSSSSSAAAAAVVAAAAAAHQAAAAHKMGKNKNFKNQTQFINSTGGNIIITKNNNISISISSTPSVSSSALGCDLNDINNCGGGGPGGGGGVSPMIVDSHNNIILGGGGGGDGHSGHCPYSDYNNYSTINCNNSSIINNNSNNKSIFKINCDIKNNIISNSTTKLDKIYNLNNNNNISNNLINSNNCTLGNEYASIPPRSCIYVNNNSCSTLDKKRNYVGGNSGGGGICIGSGGGGGGNDIATDYNNSIDSVDINIVNNKERDGYFNFNCKHFNYNLNSSPCNNQYKNDLCNMKQICNDTSQQCNNDTA